jgi:ketosteroid isomerase-like protein
MDRRSGDGTPLIPPCPGEGDPSPDRRQPCLPGLHDELIAADRAMQRAVVERDVTGFAAFLSDDYRLVDSRGRLQDKAAVLRDISDPAMRVLVYETQDHDVRIHGDAAVVIAVLQQRGIDHGVPYDKPVRFTDLWVRRGGRWVCVSGHASRLDPDAVDAQSSSQPLPSTIDVSTPPAAVSDRLKQ